MRIGLWATLSYKIFNSEKYKRSKNSPTIIEYLQRGNDERCTKVGSWFFEWAWQSTLSRASWATEYCLTCRWAADQLRLVCFWTSIVFLRPCPSDFHLFFELKNKMGGMQFQSNKEVEIWCRDFFRKLDPEFYARHGISKLISRNDKCLNVNGNYVKKS